MPCLKLDPIDPTPELAESSAWSWPLAPSLPGDTGSRPWTAVMLCCLNEATYISHSTTKALRSPHHKISNTLPGSAAGAEPFYITFIFSEESVFLDLSQAKYSALERAGSWIPGATCANGVSPHIASFSPLAYPEPQHLASQALHQSLCRNPCIPLVLQELDWKPWQIGCVSPVGGKQQAASIMGELLKTSCGFSGLGSGAACSFSY